MLLVQRFSIRENFPQGTRPFAGVGRALGWNAPVPATFVDKILELFRSGTKIAIEAAMMATDAWKKGA